MPAPGEGPRRLRRLLPVGTTLPDADWEVRHRTIGLLALLQAPALFLFALARDYHLVHAALEVAPIAALAALGLRRTPSRAAREVPTTLSLTLSSAVLVHLSGGFIEAHFHFFVVVALVTLYQQWNPFLLAIGFVLLHHSIVGVFDPGSVYNHPDAVTHPIAWASIHAAFIAMASAVGIANWKFNENARMRADALHDQLLEGKEALLVRFEEADRIKSELVAAVSHEFRTPLTSILGFLATLEGHPELPAERVADIVGRSHRQARRLERLITNLLETEQSLDSSSGTSSAEEVVDVCLRDAAESSRTPPVFDRQVSPGLLLPLNAAAARLVVRNLVSNAINFSEPGATIGVHCVRDPRGEGSVIEVTNRGPAIPDELRDTIFEPFTQGDSSNTRPVDGVGLGLHVVRQAVTASGGRVQLTCEGGLTTFRISLPAANGRGEHRAVMAPTSVEP